jgi:hypothetical protein
MEINSYGKNTDCLTRNIRAFKTDIGIGWGITSQSGEGGFRTILYAHGNGCGAGTGYGNGMGRDYFFPTIYNYISDGRADGTGGYRPDAYKIYL